ncbi:hypothetical protein ABZ897_25745 [Nonomuraea sp. NPDC046802]|uniref:hypothetical protein n=1 Tax=Nonomuraea sp. NPDC046802 TaxID=3154919 RepID=UPI0033E09404
MTDTPEPGGIDLDDITPRLKAVNDHLRTVAAPVTGDLKRREADALLRSYLEPGGFSEAVRKLAIRHLLVLVGDDDTGRRLGAIALLSRMSLAESRITVLSPATTASELLTATEYGPGRAYLLYDWITASTDRIELVNLSRKLAELGSYLVVTRDGPLSQAIEVEQPWAVPDPRELFDLCLSAFGLRAGRSSEELAHARDLAPTLPTPAAVVRLAGRLTSDDAPENEEVAAWFDTKPPMREVLAAAAPAFAHGLQETVFEPLLARLEGLCGEQPPSGPHPLLTVSDGLVVFRAPGQRAQVPAELRAQVLAELRAQVLAELVARYGYWVWQPLREWIRSLAREGPEVGVRVAEGVALLAACSFDETRQEIVEVWARGGAGEREMAGHVLSYMCADDTLAPKALRLALNWAAADDTATTAALALAGGLSVRYPEDAAKHLRLLAAGDGPAAPMAEQALALVPAP